MILLIRILTLVTLFNFLIESTWYADSYAYREKLLDKDIPDIVSLSLPFIKKYEWLRLSAYWDHGDCSIWYWTRAKSCKEVISKEEADKRIYVIVEYLVQDVENNFPTLHTEWKIALVSFAYNCHSGYKDIKKNGIERHSLWCKKASGIVLPWLVIRRNEEAKMLFNK